MPIIGGVLLRALAKVLSAFWMPLIAVALAWAIEQVTGAVSWGIFEIGFAALEFVLGVIDSVGWPSGPDWTAMARYAEASIQILQIGGVFGAITIYVTGGITRILVRTLTLGRI